jgi:signal transduction histidine kinase
MLDPIRIKQILINLIQNAIKFSRPKSVVILDAKVTKISENLAKIRLKVTDFGIGISKGDLINILTRFFRSKNPLNQQMNPYGNGIGLNVSRQLAQALKAKLWVEPRPT